MSRYTCVALVALGVMLTAWQFSIAQSARDADFDGNGIVDFGDFILFAKAFGSDQSGFDLDGNGSVDFPDFILFAQRFGEGMPEEDITVTLPGGAKLEMVWIQPGQFLMGSPVSETGRDDDEGPLHEVTITRGFYLAKYELTQAQWESVMSTRPWLLGVYTQDPKRLDFPAHRLSWQEVNTFFRKLNEPEGKEIFRLPTEAEWEYACRAGTSSPWSFGNDPTRIVDYARYYENSRAANVQEDGRVVYGSPEPQETGGVFPNSWGLYDMHGNVWEWVQDFYGPFSEESRIDPKGPDSPGPEMVVNAGWPGTLHVIKGGSFGDTVQEVRSAVRRRGRGWGQRTGIRVLMVRR